MTAFWPVALVALEFALKLCFITYILLRRPARPTSNLAWILVILVIPLAGVIAYVLVGEARLGRRRTRRHGETSRHLRRTAAHTPAGAALRRPELPPQYQPIATLAETVGDNPPVAGNSLQLIGDTELFIETIVMDIRGAQHHCHLLFYIFMDDASGRRVAEALMETARRGVACRLLVDAVGSSAFTGSTLRDELADAGVEVVEALPVNALRLLLARIDIRNHRKIAVIDGNIGYMGSQNIADATFALKPRFAPWVDAVVRVRGPVTRQLQMIFAEDWYLDTDEMLDDVLVADPPAVPDGVPTQVMGTGPNAFNQALRHLILTAFHNAHEELILTTPYFVPDEATGIALATAARRGVKTTLIVPEHSDSPIVAAAGRSHYAPLLEAGVRVFQYRKGLLHSKTLTLDRSFALIGSANLDRRSFELNFEVNMAVYDSDFASQLRFLQTSYLADSRPIAPVEWNARPWVVRLWENAAGTLSPLL